MNSQKIELLAPAGSIQCLKAACIAGADAVYLAGKRFGARAFAANFDEQGLWWARRVTKALNRKLYITLNTMIFEHEFDLLGEALDFYEVLQPNALIIQDLGIAAELKRRKSKIPLHLSTQAAWFGQGGEDELKELGITRVILPREMTSHEIEQLAGKTTLELEMFVHGAMCFSISGRCFWSIALGTRSGNRGTCAQPCRKEYRCHSEKSSEHLFSPRDLRLIERIPELLKIGVASLKIEGRMKSPEYVYQVVKAYRDALDNNIIAGNEKMLNEVYSRASATGFFDGPQPPEKWKTGRNAGREGVIAGITTGKIQNGLVEIRVKEQLSAGEGVFWYDRSERQGSRITWVKPDKTSKSTVWVRGLPTTLFKGTEIRRSSTGFSGEWEGQWDKNWERRPVDLYWSGHEGTSLAVETLINKHRLHIETDEKLKLALIKGLEEGPLQEKFAILGDQFKAGKHVTTMLGKRLHISSSALKRLKRNLLEQICLLEQQPPPRGKPGILNLLRAAEPEKADYSELFSAKQTSQIFIRMWNSCFPFLRDLKVDGWILPLFGDKFRAARVIQGPQTFWLPPVINAQHLESIEMALKDFATGDFLCFGWEAFHLAKIFPNLKFSLDSTFNVSNIAALNFVGRHGINAVLAREWPPETIPADLIGKRSNHSWNPLVSLSRFVSSVESGEIVDNSHRDQFFTIDIGNGIRAMFLKDKPASLIRRENVSLQIDVALAPDENPVQVATDLNRMIEHFRKG